MSAAELAALSRQNDDLLEELSRLRVEITAVREWQTKHAPILDTIGGARKRLAQLFWGVVTAAAIWLTINYLEGKHEQQNRELMTTIQQATKAVK